MGDIIKIQKALDDKAKAVLSKYKLPNIAGVIVRDNGNTVMHTVQGVKNSSLSATTASNKATASSYFNVGSISKPITGFLISCLIKKGILSWDTKIKDIFPEFNSKPFRDRSGMNSTFLDTKIYELLSHTSGMNGYYFDQENNNDSSTRDTDPFRFIQDLGINNGGNSRDKEWKNFGAMIYLRYLYTILSLKKKKYLFNSPKNLGYQNTAKYGYGSTATICVSMAERKMGKNWEQIMNGLLADPLNNKLQITFGPLPGGMQYHGYDVALGKYTPYPTYNNDLAPYNSKFIVGGVHCTVGGMAQFIKYNLRAINSSAVFDVAQYQMPVTNVAKGGLFLGGGAQNEPLNHNGATGASLADLAIYPHSGRGFSVMMNCGGGPAGADSWAAMAEMMQELRNIHTNWEII
ncbi:serine hydrolase [Chitinophaga sp. SYP-B3965]|uniref:serine hydrolase domain-containing protein n=1 Tax=Chitinophaga sp. SYP-B3965 TaxID=2663120 RepID=UPI001299F15E|nr:serine hydrolase domain-containing protein [Chitinophaga sp. SYP-B3965]MRG43914.1 serine hydrolase [Chitinophaga sp. SYP-B3965]